MLRVPLSGIVSYGVACNSGVPEVNTRVSTYSNLVNAYAVYYRDAVVSGSESGAGDYSNCTDSNPNCYPSVLSSEVLQDENATDTTPASNVSLTSVFNNVLY